MKRGFLKGEIQGMVREIEPNISTPDLDIYSILLASVKIGADEGAIANALDLEEAFVRECGERARRALIWEGMAVSPPALALWGGEDGAIQLGIDSNVLSGNVEIVAPGSYQLTEKGRRQVERRLQAE